MVVEDELLDSPAAEESLAVAAVLAEPVPAAAVEAADGAVELG